MTFRIDRTYVIASVSGNHLQTAIDLYNYHIQFENKKFIEVHSKDELFLAFQKIESDIDEESGPLIHIEAHGIDSQDGILLSNGIALSNGDHIGWDEIRPYLTSINAKCGNNLTMVIASCFGLYILQDLIQTFFDNVVGAQCPFFCFVGPENKLSVDDFANAFPVFYKKLAEQSSIEEAVLEMNKHSSVKFRYDTAYKVFLNCVDSFANKQIKNRAQHILEYPSLISDYYCELYFYTYGESCEFNAILKILTDEQFYLDYLNKRRRDFLHIKNGDNSRFPIINKINNFEKSVPAIRMR